MQQTLHSTLFEKIKAKAYISRQKERMCIEIQLRDIQTINISKHHSSIRHSQIVSKSILPF